MHQQEKNVREHEGQSLRQLIMCIVLLAIFGQSTIMMFVLYNRHIALMKHKLKHCTHTLFNNAFSPYIYIYIYIHIYIVHHMNVYTYVHLCIGAACILAQYRDICCVAAFFFCCVAVCS